MNPWPPQAPPAPPPGPVGGYGLALPPGVSAESAYQKPGGSGGSEPLGIVGLILGVISLPLYLCCGGLSLVLNLVGLGLGVAGLARSRGGGQGRAVAIAAVVVNGLLLLLNVLAIVFVFGVMGFGLLSSP
ncbi:MAG: hypothetical protein HYZ29_10460 [Myxococcales bacterium]|nr:hypothetical protein [Myxococcales bacterium]